MVAYVVAYPVAAGDDKIGEARVCLSLSLSAQVNKLEDFSKISLTV